MKQNGEELAVDYLKKLVFKMVIYNWCFKLVEIDIIDSRENILYFKKVNRHAAFAFDHLGDALTSRNKE